MGKKGKEQTGAKGGMLSRFVKSESLSQPDLVRYNASCGDCGTAFFGDSQSEANSRRSSHRCAKK